MAATQQNYSFLGDVASGRAGSGGCSAEVTGWVGWAGEGILEWRREEDCPRALTEAAAVLLCSNHLQEFSTRSSSETHPGPPLGVGPRAWWWH